MNRSENHMLGIVKFAVIFTAGGLLYAAMEMVFRGRTHWTMMIAGGLCTFFLYLIATKSADANWKKWIMGGAVITTVEFMTGIIVNIILGWHVWSYAHSWANLFGQICVMFALLWVVLSIPGIWLMQLIGCRVFKEGRGGMRT